MRLQNNMSLLPFFHKFELWGLFPSNYESLPSWKIPSSPERMPHGLPVAFYPLALWRPYPHENTSSDRPDFLLSMYYSNLLMSSKLPSWPFPECRPSRYRSFLTLPIELPNVRPTLRFSCGRSDLINGEPSAAS